MEPLTKSKSFKQGEYPKQDQVVRKSSHEISRTARHCDHDCEDRSNRHAHQPRVVNGVVLHLWYVGEYGYNAKSEEKLNKQDSINFSDESVANCKVHLFEKEEGEKANI